MICYVSEVMGLNLGQVEVGVHTSSSNSVEVDFNQKYNY